MTSKKNLENRIDRIDDGKNHPQLTLCELLSADEIETVDEERGIVRVDGTLMRGTLSPELGDKHND